MYSILEFISVYESVKFQAISKHFYNKIMPRCIMRLQSNRSIYLLWARKDSKFNRKIIRIEPAGMTVTEINIPHNMQEYYCI